MLGMKNHFYISDSIKISKVDIMGVACFYNVSHDKTNKTQISWASPKSDQSLRCLHEESLGP